MVFFWRSSVVDLVPCRPPFILLWNAVVRLLSASNLYWKALVNEMLGTKRWSKIPDSNFVEWFRKTTKLAIRCFSQNSMKTFRRISVDLLCLPNIPKSRRRSVEHRRFPETIVLIMITVTMTITTTTTTTITIKITIMIIMTWLFICKK